MAVKTAAKETHTTTLAGQLAYAEPPLPYCSPFNKRAEILWSNLHLACVFTILHNLVSFARLVTLSAAPDKMSCIQLLL